MAVDHLHITFDARPAEDALAGAIENLQLPFGKWRRPDTYRAGRTVEDPRFRDGAYVGSAAIDPRAARSRIEARLAELPRHVTAGGLPPAEAAAERDRLKMGLALL